MTATIADYFRNCKGLQEKTKGRMHAVGIDTLVDQVTQKEGDHHGAPGYPKQRERENKRLVWNRHKSRIEKNNRDEPLSVVFVDVFEARDELGIFVGECITTQTTKDVSNEVRQERTDGQGQNNAKEAKTGSGKDGRKGDGRNGQDNI